MHTVRRTSSQVRHVPPMSAQDAARWRAAYAACQADLVESTRRVAQRPSILPAAAPRLRAFRTATLLVRAAWLEGNRRLFDHALSRCQKIAAELAALAAPLELH